MATRDDEYRTPSSSLGVGQASASGAGGVLTAMSHWLCTVFRSRFPEASITWGMNEKVPEVFGVPAISPVEGFSVSSGGKLPAIENEYGGSPPVVLRLELYGTPTCPLAVAQPRIRGAPGEANKLKPDSVNDEFGPMVAVTASVMENGALVRPGPVTVVLELEVIGPIAPTVVLVPNRVLVLST